MSSSAWRILRARSGSLNFQRVDQVLRCCGAGYSRAISSISTPNLAGDHGAEGNGGSREPGEKSGAGKEVPGGTGKHAWRNWIEERLAHPKGADTQVTSTSGSFSERRITGSSLWAEDVGDGNRNVSFRSSEGFSRNDVESARNDPFEDDVIASHSREDSASERSSSLDLDSLIKETFGSGAAGDEKYSGFGGTRSEFKRSTVKASFVEERESSSRITGFSLNQSSLVQGSSKRVPASSPTKKPSGSLPVEFQPTKLEALDDFEYRVLGTAKDDMRDDEFLRELEEIGRSASGIRDFDGEGALSGGEDDEEWDDDKAQVLTDLALSNLEEFDLEDEERPYRLRADRLFFPGQTYDTEDLDMSKPVADLEKPTTRTRKNYSSREVCEIADFRNPRYLSNFIRETSRILPRRHHQVSAKAQKKINREIKTARVLGLMPFTSMGDPPFRFIRSRSEDDAYPGSEEE